MYRIYDESKNNTENIIAYHGSPYNFNEFDIGSVGSGEGAYGFGYGLYFTETFDEAIMYAEKLERKEKEGIVYECKIPDIKYYLNIDKELKKQSEYVKECLKKIPDKYKIKILESDFDYLEFKVDIDNNIEEYLFKKDDDEYNAHLKKILDNEFMDFGNHFFDMVKQNLGSRYSSNEEDEEKASNFLYKMGILGIVHTGFGLENYVVFSDSDIKIIGKYKKGERNKWFPMIIKEDDKDKNDYWWRR